MPYIYNIVNDINKKIYIGQTSRSIEERWKEHKKDYLYRGYNRPLYRAFNKYGIENFHIELIEETDNPKEREIYWIEKYNSFKNGYNATLGGDGKKYIDYDLVISTYQKLQCIKDTAIQLNISIDAVYYILKSNNIEIISGSEVSGKRRSKKVGMYSNNSFELLESFDSLAKAATFLKEKGYVNGSIKSVSAHISETCKGKRKTVGGFSWKFL